MHNIAVTAALFEDQHLAFPVVHETGAAIDPVGIVVQQVTQAARYIYLLPTLVIKHVANLS